METRPTDRANIKQSAFSKVRKQRKQNRDSQFVNGNVTKFLKEVCLLLLQVKICHDCVFENAGQCCCAATRTFVQVRTILNRIHVFCESRSNIFRRASMTGLWQRLRSWLQPERWTPYKGTCQKKIPKIQDLDPFHPSLDSRLQMSLWSTIGTIASRNGQI